jgi:tetratricopeptide (TPR) repeat protein
LTSRAPSDPQVRARRLQNGGCMAVSVWLLTLALPAIAGGGLDLTHAVERIPIPGTGPVTVQVEPLASRVRLEVRDAAAVARQLRAASRTLCPAVAVEGDAVVLRCTSRQISATVVPHAGGQSLEVRHLQVPPWAGRDGLPHVPFDPAKLSLGAPCPGDAPAGAGECALASGHLQRAEELFREAREGPGAALAALRLGDLAARAGDLQEAVRSWKEVAPGSPFGRLAAARLCETDPRCIASGRSAFLFASAEAHPALRADLVLRQARLEAFLGKALEAAQALAPEHARGGACTAEPQLCGDVLLAALREPGARGAQALALYLEVPSRDRGPLAVELAAAAADRAAASGAPVFAANLLSAVSGQVAAPQLADHLARTAELYLDGGDRARGGVVLEFARSRLPRPTLASARWARIARGVAGRTGSATPAPRPEVAGAEDDLQAASRAVAGARGGTGGKP